MDSSLLISYKNIKCMIASPYPNEKASIVSDILSQSLLIVNNVLYTLQPNMTYTKSTTDIKIVIQACTTKLMEASFRDIPEKKQQKIREEKNYKSLFSNKSGVLDIYPQIYSNLQKNDAIFDHTLCEIHFNNGYYDLNSQTLKPRVLHHHYITKFIERDYIPSSIPQQDELLKHIYKVYPEHDLKSILLILGSALSGKSSLDQELLFLLGKGSSGKSMTMQLTKATIGPYYNELQSNTFSVGNPKIDKILNSFLTNPQIRITCINEMEDKKMDGSLFKSFCDSHLTTTELYKDGQKEFDHHSKLIFTSNNMPNIQVDTGISRRFRGYTHGSTFTHDINIIDDSDRIYLLDKDIIKNITDNNLLNAWFDILANKCKSWLDGEKLLFNANFAETKSTVMSSNDIFQDFIDSILTTTKNPSDRIGKNAMYDAFTKMYPTKHLTVLQVINSLKEKNIQYSQKERCDKVQGCFSFVKFSDDIDDDDEDVFEESPLDSGLIKEINYKEEYFKLLKRVEELELMQLKNNV